MNIDIIYKKVLDYNLIKHRVLNGKLKPVNFKYALIDKIISEDEYDFYFKNES